MASLLGTELLEEAGVEITGIVDHDVDPAEFGDGVCDRGVCVLKAGDVELDSQQVLMAADRRRDLGRIATGGDNRVAGGQRCLGKVEAQATARAGDEPNLFVSHGKFLSLISCCLHSQGDFDAPVSPTRPGAACQIHRNLCLKQRLNARNGDAPSCWVLD